MRTERLVCAVVLSLLAASAGCDGGDGGKQQSCGEGGPCGSASLMLTGRVLDANQGHAVKNAALATTSGESAKSDAGGRFELSAQQDPQRVEVTKQNYVAAARRPPEQGGYMEVFIKSVDLTQDFDAAVGVKVVLDSGVTLDIPGGAVRDADGKPVKGKMTLSLADVDGKVRSQASALPGELKGETKQGEKGLVSPERALQISIADSKGEKMQVAADADVVAEFPSKEADAPQRSSLSFDEDKDVWVEEGKVARAENGKGEPVYRKDIDHLSWHGYGDFFDELTCLRACVVDAKKTPRPGAQIWLVGKTFAGVSSLFAGADGCAVGTAPVGQQIVLVGQAADGVSEPTEFMTGKTATAADDLAACGRPKDLVISSELSADCPAGYTACDGACLDPAAGVTVCPQDGAGDGGVPGAGDAGARPGVTDPAPNLTAPGETRCETCPDTDITDFELELGAVTSTTLRGTVTGAEGNGKFYVVGADGAAIQGTIATDPTSGSYSVALPLFCGEQTVKLLWTNSSGETVAVLRVITTDCVDADIRVTLSWDDKGRDFELHLIREGGTINDGTNDCTWTSCIGSGPDWGMLDDASDNPLKDVDNTGNYGPENITLAKPEALTYTVMVEHWGSSGLPEADGQVIINTRGGASTIIDITDLAPSHVFTAATVDWPSGVVTAVGSDYDCSANWSGGCRDAIP